MRFQLLMPDELFFDLQNYGEDNNIKPSEMVRQLIRREIYFTHYFCRPLKIKKKKTIRSSDDLGDL